MRFWMDFVMDFGINFESISDLFSRAFRRKRNKNSKKRKVREASAASEASAKSSETFRNSQKQKEKQSRVYKKHVDFFLIFAGVL